MNKRICVSGLGLTTLSCAIADTVQELTPYSDSSHKEKRKKKKILREHRFKQKKLDAIANK